jgi:hypothetical protein
MKKFLIITISVIVLLLGALIAAPFLFKDKIVALVKEQANENINAKVNFDNDIELSLIKNFPNFTLGINNLSVIGINEFEGDTLIALKNFSATLDVMSVIKGDQIKVIRILLDEPIINALVNKDGKANWDITKPSTDTTATETDTAETKFNIALKKLEIKHARIVYDDKPGNMSAHLIDFNHTLTGDFSQDNFLLSILMDCGQLTYVMDGVPYLSKVKLAVEADIDANMKDMKFTFKENKIALNELAFGFDGWVAMPTDDIDMDIKYEAKQGEFKHFLSLVPAIYAKDFADVKTSGKLAFNGFAKGKYNDKSLPAFAFNLLVENAMFQYPALPAPVNNIQINFTATNPTGNLDDTKVDLSKFHFEVMGDPFDMRLIATNVMKDPNIDAAFKGRLNFDNIVKIVPLDEGMKLSGLMNIDMTAVGKMSTIEKEQYDQFDAKGNMSLTKFMFASNDLPKPYYINDAALTFNPKTVSLTKFDAKIGNSDMQMNGELSNFFAYTFGHGTLKGLLNFSSNQIDANEFLTPDEAAPAQPVAEDTSSLTAPEIPDNIDFTLNAKINKLLYTNMDIENFGGQIKIADSKLSFNKVALNTLGAAIKMDGYYETSNPKRPSMNMDFGISNMEFQKAFKTFNTIKKVAPIAEKMVGNFSTTFKMQTSLDQHLNPVYDSLYAFGNLTIPHAELHDVKLFNKAAEVLKYSNLNNPALQNVNIKFEVKNGRITTQPFDMNVAGQKLVLSGSTGLDQTIDYIGKVAIPRSALGGTANGAVNDLLAQANAKAGTNVKVSDIINVNLGLGGTFTNPKVTTNLADIAKGEANSVKDQLKNEIDRKKKELEDKAKAEADRLKKEGEAKAKAEVDKAKAQAKAEADRLKKEAEAKAKAESDKAKKQAEDEAKKRLKGMLGK